MRRFSLQLLTDLAINLAAFLRWPAAVFRLMAYQRDHGLIFWRR